MTPTDRQMACIRAWWKSGGSTVGAAMLLDRREQTVKNTLMAARRRMGVRTNLDLAIALRGELGERAANAS